LQPKPVTITVSHAKRKPKPVPVTITISNGERDSEPLAFWLPVSFLVTSPDQSITVISAAIDPADPALD
jgi:hypothetical protein